MKITFKKLRAFNRDKKTTGFAGGFAGGLLIWIAVAFFTALKGDYPFTIMVASITIAVVSLFGIIINQSNKYFSIGALVFLAAILLLPTPCSIYPILQK